MLREQFDENDVHEILKRAVSLDDAGTRDLQTRLSMAATELGLSPESVKLAQDQWAKEKALQRKEALAAKKRLQEFKVHAAIFAVVNFFLVLLNFMTWSEDRNPHPWVLYVLFSWGLGLAVHAITLKYPEVVSTGDESEPKPDS